MHLLPSLDVVALLAKVGIRFDIFGGKEGLFDLRFSDSPLRLIPRHPRNGLLSQLCIHQRLADHFRPITVITLLSHIWDYHNAAYPQSRI